MGLRAEAADRRGTDGDRAAGSAREHRPAGGDRRLRRTDPPDDARLPRRPRRRRRASSRPRAPVGVAGSPDLRIPPSAGIAVPRRAAAHLRRRAVHLHVDPRRREPVPPPGAVSAPRRDRDPRPADRRLPPLRAVRAVPLHDGARHRPRREPGARLRAARRGGPLQDRRPLPRRRGGPFRIRRVLRRSARDPVGDGQVRPRQQRPLPRAEDGKRQLRPQRGRPRPAPGGFAVRTARRRGRPGRERHVSRLQSPRPGAVRRKGAARDRPRDRPGDDRPDDLEGTCRHRLLDPPSRVMGARSGSSGGAVRSGTGAAAPRRGRVPRSRRRRPSPPPPVDVQDVAERGAQTRRHRDPGAAPPDRHFR